MKKWSLIVALILVVLLSLAASVPKLLRAPQEVTFFGSVGLPENAVLLFGLLQLAGAVLLVFKPTRRLGAALAGLMFLGSAIMVSLSGNIGFAVFSLLPVVLAGFVLKGHSKRDGEGEGLVAVPSQTGSDEASPGGLDYDQLLHLDSEDLAEGGIGGAHHELLPKIRVHAPDAGPVEDRLDDEVGSYSVAADGRDYPIYAPDLPDGQGESWGRATHALFAIVNAQLAETPVRFYAINGGNDLGGIFLTEEEAESARTALEIREDWPYLPTTDHPWYGMFHSQ